MLSKDNVAEFGEAEFAIVGDVGESSRGWRTKSESGVTGVVPERFDCHVDAGGGRGLITHPPAHGGKTVAADNISPTGRPLPIKDPADLIFDPIKCFVEI